MGASDLIKLFVAAKGITWVANNPGTTLFYIAITAALIL